MTIEQLNTEYELKVYTNLLSKLESKANLECDKELKEAIWEQCTEIRERISELNWVLKDPDMKQANRIQYLTMVKRHKGDTHKILANIDVYEKVRQTIPYVLAVNESSKLDDLLFLSRNILLRIDWTKMFRDEFATIDEIENAFKSFFRIELENEYEMFPYYYESEVKIRELYAFLKNIIYNN